jgi:hypothetical protein
MPAAGLRFGENGLECADDGSDDRCDTRSHVVSELVKEVWLMPET